MQDLGNPNSSNFTELFTSVFQKDNPMSSLFRANSTKIEIDGNPCIVVELKQGWNTVARTTPSSLKFIKFWIESIAVAGLNPGALKKVEIAQKDEKLYILFGKK